MKEIMLISFIFVIFLFQFFGFCAMVAYGIDAFLKFHAVKSGQLAQGDRVMSKQTTAVTTPTY